MPRPRSFPAFTCGSAVAIESNMTGIWPPNICTYASGAPLNGTWFNWMPATARNISIARCCVLPVPTDA